MAMKVFHLLKTGLSHAGLSNVTQKILGIINVQFAGEHPLVGPGDTWHTQKAGSQHEVTRYGHPSDCSHLPLCLLYRQ
jgi:hypothetical protein